MSKFIVIIAGEPESVNSEIIAKAWKKLKKNHRKNLIIIGNYKLIKKQLNKFKIKIPIQEINSITEVKNKHKLPILNIPLKFKKSFKISKNENSKYIIRCFEKAHYLAAKKVINGFINCSIDKRKTFGEKKIGVTEYLSKKNKLKNDAVMLIYNKKLAVAPLTTHIDVKKISNKINLNMIVKKTNIINTYFSKLIKRKPKIAILGLNPHNSEFSNKSEEKKIIIPAINELKNKRLNVFGPVPADTVFSNRKKYSYDVILGMYHDQVLAPFKALYGYDAINITLGLPYLRVSPDHGTAKDLMGLNKANCYSLLECIKFFRKNNAN